MTTIKVIILDDHPLIRQGIRSILVNSPDIEIVGEGGAGEELKALIHAHQPDVVLLDLNMPEKADETTREGRTFKPFEALAWLAQASPQTRVLIISQQLDAITVERAAQADVRGYVLKEDAVSQDLAEAIRAVYRGGVYFSSAVSQMLHGHPTSASPSPTRRHLEILQAILLDPNLTYAEHAKRLNITENTLHNHLSEVFSRLGASNLAAALVKAIRLHLIDPKDGT